MVEHVNITDPYIHEPKGAAAANSGDIYVADGAGSGSWTAKNTLFGGIAYGFMSTYDNATATSIPTATEYEQVAGTFTGITLYQFTFSSNSLVIPVSGVYLVLLNARLTQSGGASQEYELGVSNGVATATKKLTIPDTESVEETFTSVLPFTAAQSVHPVVTNTTNDNKGLTATNCFLTLVLLRNT